MAPLVSVLTAFDSTISLGVWPSVQFPCSVFGKEDAIISRDSPLNWVGINSPYSVHRTEIPGQNYSTLLHLTSEATQSHIE